MSDRNFRPPLSYYGGKYSASPWIISYFPLTKTYVEPFFGSGTVFFSKFPRSDYNVVNDKDDKIVNFFRMLREKPDELINSIMLTPYARSEYEKCYMQDAEDDMERARQTFVTLRQSRLHTTKQGPRQWTKGYKKKHHTPSDFLKESLEMCSSFLNGVIIENTDAIDLIKTYNEPDCLIYCDPPYVLSERTGSAYGEEMTDDDHMEFLNTVNESEAKIVISGYDNDLYNRELSNWNKEVKEFTCTIGKNYDKRDEVLWLNFGPPVKQKRLF